MIRQGWATTDLEARISHHVREWGRLTKIAEPARRTALPFVTIQRDFGCEALRIAQMLSVILNQRFNKTIAWVAYDRELLDRVASELHLRREVVEAIDGSRRDEMAELFDSLLNRKVPDTLMVQKLAEVVRSLALRGHTILVGRGSHLVTKDLKSGLHVRLTAPRLWRVNRVAACRKIPSPTAEQVLVEGERERRHFLNTFFVQDPQRPFQHDLIVDVSQFAPADVAKIIAAAVATRGLALAA